MLAKATRWSFAICCDPEDNREGPAQQQDSQRLRVHRHKRIACHQRSSRQLQIADLVVGQRDVFDLPFVLKSECEVIR